VDVELFQSNDGGEITIVNGLTTMSDGLATSVYLSLFGGNSDDSGIQGDNAKQWWANFSEPDPSRIYRSETQNLLRSMPLIPSNLRRVEDAALRDLDWMTTELDAGVAASASMPALNTLGLQIAVLIDSRKFDFSFVFKKAA
jgi:phage gp46-like protein